MKGTLRKFEPTKEGITVIIQCEKGADMHSIVDMLDKEIEFGMQSKEIPAYEFDQILPICRMIEESRQKEYKRGLSEAAEAMEQTLLKGGDNEQ